MTIDSHCGLHRTGCSSKQTQRIIRDFYNAETLNEWNRIAGRPEFIITCRFLDRYIKPGDSVLDIGGGPGRYSLYLAEKGCDVTLFDLAQENLIFATKRAAEQDLRIKTVCGDARVADELRRGGMFLNSLFMAMTCRRWHKRNPIRNKKSKLY